MPAGERRTIEMAIAACSIARLDPRVPRRMSMETRKKMRRYSANKNRMNDVKSGLVTTAKVCSPLCLMRPQLHNGQK